VPLRQADFVQLVSLLYPHPAAEDAARALWRRFLVGEDPEPDTATHLGPSVEMISRLDLRHRKQGQTSLIFRDPDQNTAHEKVLAGLRSQSERGRARQVLVGAMRVIDQHWASDAAPSGIGTRRSPRPHPAAALPPEAGWSPSMRSSSIPAVALFAWVKNEEELERICKAVGKQLPEQGRTPVVAFTASCALMDKMAGYTLKHAKTYLMLYQLSSTEAPAEHRDPRELGMTAFESRAHQLAEHF
jgi:hypothetical protein